MNDISMEQSYGWGARDPESAINKAKEVLETMEKERFDPTDAVFISVGGADGTELEYLLKNTPACYGILLEFDDHSADLAKEKARQLAGSGKWIQVYTGDASQKVDLALNLVDTWHEEGKIGRIVLTMHAVLHEFPNRGSRTSDIERFLSRFIHRGKLFMPVLAIAREPCMPEGLPEKVYLFAKDKSPNNLAELAEAIRNTHPEFQNQEGPVAMSERVRMGSRLAIETIMKLFYIESFAYEIEERNTAFTKGHLVDAFRMVFETENVQTETFQTGSFVRLWREHGINLYDQDKKLPVPECHVRIVARWIPPDEPRVHPEENVTASNESLVRKDSGGVTIRLYHWENSSTVLSEKGDIVLDWSQDFDRQSRRVPDPSVWRNRLIPDLEETQKGIPRDTLIRFRGSACLSAGFALGWAFREVKGYTFEIQQGSDLWRSDAKESNTRHWVVEEVSLPQGEYAKDLSIEISQQADITLKVAQFAQAYHKKFRAKIILRPDLGIGARIDGPTALAYAFHAKQEIRQAVDRYQCKRVHLFYAGPLGLAILLGRLFNAMHADIQCYEEQNEDGYTPSWLLPEGPLKTESFFHIARALRLNGPPDWAENLKTYLK